MNHVSLGESSNPVHVVTQARNIGLYTLNHLPNALSTGSIKETHHTNYQIGRITSLIRQNIFLREKILICFCVTW